jgi:hypothetical protein
MHQTRAIRLEKDQRTDMTIPQKHLIFKDKSVYLQIRNKSAGQNGNSISHEEGKIHARNGIQMITAFGSNSNLKQ